MPLHESGEDYLEAILVLQIIFTRFVQRHSQSPFCYIGGYFLDTSSLLVIWQPIRRPSPTLPQEFSVMGDNHHT